MKYSNRKNSNNIKGVPGLNQRTIRKIAKTKYGIPVLIVIGIVVVVFQFFNSDNDTTNQQNADGHVTYETAGEEIVPGERYEVEVSRITDGDTISFYFNGAEERFRFITIDAPEIDHEHGNHDAFAIEALEHVEALLSDAEVISVEFDTGELQDDYGRYLAYIYADDVMLNIDLVREGLATVRYTNTDNRKYLDDMYEAEEAAQVESLGVWSE